MDWFFSIIRIAGVAFPGASSFVQLQAEIDSKALLQRVVKLEDPISHLHDDVPEVSRQIYQKMKVLNSAKLDFDDEFYKKYSRALAVIESKGYIKGGHALSKNYAAGIRLVDPSYIMYLCALEENEKKMESLVKFVNDCKVGQWLDGKKMDIGLPLPVIKAVFDIYESKGFGICSKEPGSCNYKGKA